MKVLDDGFVKLVNHMGDDNFICDAARVSYGNHQNEEIDRIKNRNLIRYLMRHRHTTPFEMVSFVFLVRAPIHVARQWFRHRTWSYNEYSTRYKEAINSMETTPQGKWRSQSTNNKQGSGDYLDQGTQERCEAVEKYGQTVTRSNYEIMLNLGVAKEQARKDLPLSTYTEFYAKVDLHNLFHFLSLRMDSHAQYEIRVYANAIYEHIKPLVPLACEAFEDYRLNGCFFSKQEMEVLREYTVEPEDLPKPSTLSDREWAEFQSKLGVDNG